LIKKNLNILIVEDEFLAISYLKDILQKIGFEKFFVANNAELAKKITFDNNIELIFMDINISGSIDGINCAKSIDNKIPIIYTTAFIDIDTINETEQTNSFGYIIKPFSYEDVYSTLNVALRLMNKELLNNQSNNNDHTIKLGNYIYYKKSKTLKYNGNIIDLTKKEIEVLNQLCLNINQQISYTFLIDKIWYDKDISLSTIRDTLSRLKKKVPTLDIQNIQNHGYILKVPQ
jgi:DNA-binding response OmpR family regulator